MNVTNTPCTELKEYYNNTLNKDKSLYETSNDVSTPTECIEEMVSKVPEDTMKILNHPLYTLLNNIHRYGNFNNVKILQSFPQCKSFETVYKELEFTKD